MNFSGSRVDGDTIQDGSYFVRVLADSINEFNGIRLTSLLCKFPRFILAEVDTHRMISKSSASSRAVPVRLRIDQVRADPFVPEAFGKKRPGMQATENLDEGADNLARASWLAGAEYACQVAAALDATGVHKQHANRVLEPYSWHTAVLSATDWENFFALRISPMAQPEFRKIAEMMRAMMDRTVPKSLQPGQWHLPFVYPSDFEPSQWSTWEPGHGQYAPAKLSAGRCCRVSYLTHDGKRDPVADVALAETLVGNGHMAPLEHPAMACQVASKTYVGNFAGWMQYRKMIKGEAVYHGA